MGAEIITIIRDPATGVIEIRCDGIESHLGAIMMCATAIHALHTQHDDELTAREPLPDIGANVMRRIEERDAMARSRRNA